MGTHWSAHYLGETGPQERRSRVRGVFTMAPALATRCPVVARTSTYYKYWVSVYVYRARGTYMYVCTVMGGGPCTVRIDQSVLCTYSDIGMYITDY